MSERVQNLEATFALLESLPDAAREELGELLREIGWAVHAFQAAQAPVDTGYLKQGLTVAVELEKLRLRAGYPTLGKSRSSRFYAIVQEYGRRAGSKQVQRRRRVNGKLRLQSRRKRAEDISSTYTARWTALAPRPFVHVEDRVEGIINGMTENFWNNVRARAGEA